MDASFFYWPVRPRFLLEVDIEAFRQDTGIELTDAEMVISVRDFAVKHYSVLFRSSLDSCPESWISQDDIDISSGRDALEFDLFICLSRQLEPASGRAYRIGSVLATKKFIVRPEVASIGFPVVATNFAERGWPEQALWRVEFLNYDFSLPANEVVAVHINERANANLRRLLTHPVVGGLYARTLAADILTDVAFEVLGVEDSGNDESNNGEGIRTNLLERLSEAMNVREEQVLERIRSGGMQWLRSEVQAMYGLNDQVANLDTRRLR